MGDGALECARRGQQLLLGYTVCDIGQDGGCFGEDPALDGKGRYFAQRIDGSVALREIGLCLGVDLDGLVSETRLLECDMTGERAGHRAVKELEHGSGGPWRNVRFSKSCRRTARFSPAGE